MDGDIEADPLLLRVVLGRLVVPVGNEVVMVILEEVARPMIAIVTQQIGATLTLPDVSQRSVADLDRSSMFTPEQAKERKCWTTAFIFTYTPKV